MAAVLCKGVLQTAKASCAGILRPRVVTTTAMGQHVAATVEQQTPVSPRPVTEIPGPATYPLVGSIPGLWGISIEKRKPHQLWEIMFQEYGPIVRLVIPFLGPMVAIVTGDDCKNLHRAVMDNPQRPPLGSIKKIREESGGDFFDNGGGIFNAQGEEWWRLRSRVQTTMMKPKNILTYLHEMDEVSLEFMDRIAAWQTQYGEMPSDFLLELYKWALESLGLVALSCRLGCLDPNISSDSEQMRLIKLGREMFKALEGTEMNLHLWKYFPTKSYKTLKRTHQEFAELAERIIRETEASLLALTPSQDRDLTLLETLLLTPGLSHKDVVTVILDMLIGGIETTAHTVAFTLYLLARNPEVQTRLQQEVDSVLGHHKGPLTQKHLAQLSYLKAVFKESLRVYPLTLGLARILDKDIVLRGYIVPAGVNYQLTHLVFSVAPLSCWDESVFPRAKEFLPERWFRDRPLGPIHPYASLPFGVGTRMCIGRRIAEQEIYTFLARVMQRFTVDYKYEDLEHVASILYVPSHPLKFNFTERH